MRGALAVGLADEVPPACPECGGKVAYGLACHTYGQGDKFYACLPCDSAISYFCAEWLDDKPTACRWEYTHGLNPLNPRSAANEARRPPWIPASQPFTENWRAPGVPLNGSQED